MPEKKKDKKTTSICYEESEVNVFCEACGDDLGHLEEYLDDFNYCPYCGRKIRGK